MKKAFLFVATLAAISFYGCSKDDEAGQVVNPQDIGFVFLSVQNNAAEIALGQLASDSSQTPEIKAFGQKMVTEHGTTLAELESIATNIGINTPDTLQSRHVKLIEDLKKLKGRSFDSLYIYNQVNDHLNAVLLHENAHAIGSNIQLKTYMGDVLPHLLSHLQEAQTLAAGY